MERRLAGLEGVPMPDPICPDRKDLEQFASGTIDEATFAKIETHLASACETCLSVLDSLPAAEREDEILPRQGRRIERMTWACRRNRIGGLARSCSKNSWAAEAWGRSGGRRTRS